MYILAFRTKLAKKWYERLMYFFQMREEIEEVVTTEEYLNGVLEHEGGQFTKLDNDKIEISKVCRPKFTVTSYTIDPPVDRFRDSIYCLDTSVDSANSNLHYASFISSNEKCSDDDATLEFNNTNQTIKVPFPEFGVDLILANQTKRKQQNFITLSNSYP